MFSASLSYTLKMQERIPQLRKEYVQATLDEQSVADKPEDQFRKWLNDAVSAEIPEANAMMLSTVSVDNKPSSRIVLLRDFTEKGLGFFTNYLSRKGHDIEQNPFGAITFFWPQLERQIRVEGKITKADTGVSDAYFAQRPRGSQLGAWISMQSSVIPDRDSLKKKEDLFDRQFAGADVTRPDYWGGYYLLPDYFEFWQGRENRLHDRVCYRREEGGWEIFRIAP